MREFLFHLNVHFISRVLLFLIRCLISDVSVEIVQGDKPSIACNYEHNLYNREHYRELERSKFPSPEGEILQYKCIRSQFYWQMYRAY